MTPLSVERLQQIAIDRRIDYAAPPEEDFAEERSIKTVLSKAFSLPQEGAFNTFADPQNHVKYFTLIKSCTPLIPLEGALDKDEYVVLEHVQEQDLPPRMMIVRYKLDPPYSIIKEAVTSPFGAVPDDRKRGTVTLSFDKIDRNTTKLTCESEFHTSKGPVFVREFIDHVWINFFERLMVETAEINASDMFTDA